MNEELSIICNAVHTKVMFGETDIAGVVTHIEILITPEGPKVLLEVMPSVINIKHIPLEEIKMIIHKE